MSAGLSASVAVMAGTASAGRVRDTKANREFKRQKLKDQLLAKIKQTKEEAHQAKLIPRSLFLGAQETEALAEVISSYAVVGENFHPTVLGLEVFTVDRQSYFNILT